MIDQLQHKALHVQDNAVTYLGVEAIGGGVQQVGSSAPAENMVPQGAPLQVHTVHQPVLCRPCPLCTPTTPTSAQLTQPCAETLLCKDLKGLLPCTSSTSAQLLKCHALC